MRFLYFLSILIIPFVALSQQNTKSTGFIENKGQIVDQKGNQNNTVKYLLNTNGLNIQLRNNGFSYDVYETKKHPIKKRGKKSNLSNFPLEKHTNEPEYSLEYIFHRVDIDFKNSNPNVALVSEEKSKDYDNYYNISAVPDGILDVHKYQKVIYKNIYNNIDVIFFLPVDKTKHVEYNFVIRPGGKISDIAMKVNGAKTDLVDNKLKMQLRFGVMEESLPLSWTENNSSKEPVSIKYKQFDKNLFGFEGVNNSEGKTIVIDPTPTRLWGTYYGGTAEDLPLDIVNDTLNNVYFSGISGSSSNIATSGTHQDNLITTRAGFVVKMNNAGVRIWGTYYQANLMRINVDTNFNVYATGSTLNSSGISTLGSHQPIKNNYTDAFLIKLNSNGTRDWATYYGGEENEDGMAITFDSNQNIYLCGQTNSNSSISTSGSFQEIRGSTTGDTDGFIVKFDPNGNRIWATYYGGLLPDGVFNCFVSSDNFLYVSGVTLSNNAISTPSSFQVNKNGNTDSFITKFDLNGNRIWGTYIGGEGNDYFSFKGSLKNQFLYLVGSTGSTTNIATSGVFLESYQAVPSTSSSYAIIKFDIQNQSKIWGTYFIDRVDNLAVDNLDNVYFVGETFQNTGITTTNSYLPVKDAYLKIYLTKLKPDGQREWGTYYGGNRATQNAKVSVDNLNFIYLYGQTNGDTEGIATLGAHQETLGSNPDCFIAKFKDCLSSAIASSNSPICVGQNLQLNATGGTNYSWSGPNGFTSSLQNPIINNATAINSGTYSCSITGTGGCDDTITINIIVGDTTKPIPNANPLPTVTGDCNISIASPTATDNCAGQITATTTDPLSYTVAGNYTIHWTYNDGNGNIETQNQNIVITPVTLPTTNTQQSFCIQQNASLSNINITGQNIKWFDAQTGGNLLPTNTLLQSGVTYYASQTINNCESGRVGVTITIYNTPAPTATANQSFCSTQNATIADIVVTGSSIKWYSNPTATTSLPSTTPLQHNTTYYASQTLNNCESVERVAVTITLINTLNANNFSTYFCDDLDAGHIVLDLTYYNTSLISSVTGNTFSYYTTYLGAQNQTASDRITNFGNYNLLVGTSKIYVRIDNTNSCFQIVELDLTLYGKPKINIDDIKPICEGNTITVNPGNFDSYLWSTGATSPSLTIGIEGNYSVMVTQNHSGINCSTTKSFKVVKSNKATIEKTITTDWTSDSNSITIIITSGSVGDYEYSLDGINYQTSNTFTNLANGKYTVYIRDKNGCGITEEEVYLLMYPKFFTPNNDGYNDYWKIKFAVEEPNIIIKIFDRYGKLLKQLSNDSQGWDGTYLEQALPADDYWFTLIRANGNEYKGHFSLKR